MTDDQQLESMRVMENVKRLVAARGVTFTNSFVSLSLCCPSRATFLTGQYAHNHGVRTNSFPGGGYRALDHSRTLAVWLSRAGYHTVLIGKYLNEYGLSNPRLIPPGWSEWYGAPDPDAYAYYGYRLNENGRLVRYGRSARSYQTDVYARKAVEVIKRRAARKQPYFLWVAFLAPHSASARSAPFPGLPFGLPIVAPRHRGAFATEPLPRPPSFNEADMSDKERGMRARPLMTPKLIRQVTLFYRRRLASLLAVDEAVASIVKAVEQSNDADNTLIIFTSDNGFFQGEHRIPNGKIQPYEPGVRVPLLMRGPGIPAGRHLGQIVWNGDLAPTIVDYAHAKPDRVFDGRSLRPLFRDPGLQWGRDLLIESTNPEGFAVRTRRFKYVVFPSHEVELYDLQNDPDETRSLDKAPAYASIKAQLANQLAQLLTCTGAVCRAGPALRLEIRPDPARNRCVRGDLFIRVTGRDRRLLERVQLFAAGRRVGTAPSPSAATRIRRSVLPRGRSVRLRARATTVDGRLRTLDRRITRCD